MSPVLVGRHIFICLHQDMHPFFPISNSFTEPLELNDPPCPGSFLEDPLSPTSFDYPEVVELAEDTHDAEVDKTTGCETQKTQNYLSRSAIALRCRVMPPPCIKNPYQKDVSEMDIDPFGNQRAKCAGGVQLD